MWACFSIAVKFDERQYKYFLYIVIKLVLRILKTTTTTLGGMEDGRHLPDALKGIFTPEFVRRFVFDGEQARKNDGQFFKGPEETIRYLYKLDELDEIYCYEPGILSNSKMPKEVRSSKVLWAICALDRKALKLQSLNYKNAQHISAKVLKHFEDERKEKEITQRDALR